MSECWDKLYYNVQLSNAIWFGIRDKIAINGISRREAFNHLKFIDCCLSNPFKTNRWIKVWDFESFKSMKHLSSIGHLLEYVYNCFEIKKFLYTNLSLNKWSSLGARHYVDFIRNFFDNRGTDFTYELLLPKDVISKFYTVKRRKAFQKVNDEEEIFRGKMNISLYHENFVEIFIYLNNEEFNIVDLLWYLISGYPYPCYINSKILDCSCNGYILIKNLLRFLDIKRNPSGKLRFDSKLILSYLGASQSESSRSYLKQCLLSDLSILFPDKKFKIRSRKKKSLIIEWSKR